MSSTQRVGLILNLISGKMVILTPSFPWRIGDLWRCCKRRSAGKQVARTTQCRPALDSQNHKHVVHLCKHSWSYIGSGHCHALQWHFWDGISYWKSLFGNWWLTCISALIRKRRKKRVPFESCCWFLLYKHGEKRFGPVLTHQVGNALWYNSKGMEVLQAYLCCVITAKTWRYCRHTCVVL